MMKRLALMLVALLVLGFAVAGCGDDEESSSKSGGDTTEKSSGSDGSGGSGSDPSSGDADKAEKESGKDDTPGLSGAQVKEAEERCNQVATAQPQISDNVKNEIKKICKDAANGDEAAVKEGTKKVCKLIVEESAPAGPARDQALTACEQSTQ